MNNNQLMQMSKRLEEIRTILDISVEEMASVADVTLEEYLACERGERDMSFTFLHRCADRFHIDISELVAGDMPKLTRFNITRNGEGMVIRREDAFDYRHIAPLLKDRLSEPFIVTAKYSDELAHTPITLTTHDGQEFDYVLSGRLRVQIDDHIEELNPGDTLYCNSSLPHGMVAVGGEDCRFISVVIKGELEHEEESPHNDSVWNTSGKELIYQRFTKEEFDEHGYLKKISFNYPENFNFAYDVVDELAVKCPDKVAMTWLSKHKERKDITFGEMSRYSSKTANYLASLGVKRGDKVMVVLKRHYQFWYVINALHKLGAVAIPATNLLTTKDFEYRFQAAGVKCIICTTDDNVTKFVDEAQKKCPTLELKICAPGGREGWHDFDREMEFYSEQFSRPEGMRATDPMLMYFTSGTVGQPKIAAHDFTYPLGHIVTARYWHNVDPDGLHFTIAETGWGKAVWGKLYGQWLCEAAVFTYDFDKFEAHDILPLFKEYGITTFCAPPTMYRFFIKADLDKYDLSSIKYATIAGEALNPEVFDQFRKATGLKIMEGFGQTETTLSIANLIGMEPKPGSMGKPTPVFDVDIVDADGNPTKVGEEGEIVVRTGEKKVCGMFIGYYNDEAQTNYSWHDGVYHTGDMAWRDEDGYFWYVGRIDDVIKSSGYRIGPFEIESVLMELPYVLECAVTGFPDETRGQVVKASIILTDHSLAGDELVKEIQSYVKKRTAPYKYPRIVEFVESLPKTISGKIRRKAIRDNKE